MQKELTEQQEIALENYKKDYYTKSLKRDRLDRELATNTLKNFYKIFKKKDISEVIFFDSLESMWSFAKDNSDLTYDKIVSNTMHPSTNSYWISYFSFITNILGISKEKELINAINKLFENCGSFMIFDNIALMSDRPTVIKLKDNIMHCDNGPALAFVDGLGSKYYLNGVEVTERIVMNDNFSKEEILNEKNADVRREIVRKLSPEKLIEILNPKILDSYLDYTLYAVDLGDGRVRPFLKMINPSINTIHIEGVKDSKTVKEAIIFRNQLTKFKMPKYLDAKLLDETSNYYQQGDALFFKISEIASNAVISNNPKIASEGLIRHIVVNGNVYEVDSCRFLKAEENCSIDHPEHKSLFLPQGVYEIKKVLEYDHWLKESREVID